jgi:hypothetical protein
MERDILKTDDYSLFRFSPLNRPVSNDHVNELVRSIKLNNQLDVNPILVNTEFYIVSGQHRFLAAKKLKLPIYYVIKDVPDTYFLTANQDQRRCTLADTITFYRDYLNNDDYKLLGELIKEFTISVSSIAALIGGPTVTKHKNIHRGNFKLGQGPEETRVILDNFRELFNFLKTQPFEYKGAYKTAHFCQGLARFMSRDISWPLFMKKVRVNWSMLDTAMPNADRWCKRIFEVYNKRSRNHIAETDFVIVER